MNRANANGRIGGTIILALFLSLCHLATSPPRHSTAWAAVPWLINYQGRLTDISGKSVSGSFTFTFRLYDAATGGTKQWEEGQSLTIAEADSGVFSAVLGSVTDLASVDFNSPLWLSVQVNDDGEMTPRQRLTAIGYAMNADQLDSLDSTKFVRADIDTSTSGKLTITRSGVALMIKPSTDPSADTKLLDVQNAAGTSKFSVDLEGDVTVLGNLSVSGTMSGSSSTTGTTNATWTIDSDNTSGTEPANGAGVVIEGGSGDASILWDATNDELDINKNVNVSGTLNATSLTIAGTSAGDITGVSAGTGLTGGGTSGDVALALDTPVSVANGGTGASSLTSNGVIYGGGTGALAATSAGTTGTVLHGNTGAAPSFSAVSLTADVSGTLPLASGGTNNASLTNCTSGQVLTVSGGAVECTSTITASTISSHTLDNAFDDGKTIDGANSSSNAVQIGDGTDDLLFYTASGAPTIATDGTSDLTIAPDGSDVNVTGDLVIDTKTFSANPATGGLFIAQDPSASDSDGYIFLGRKSSETGGWGRLKGEGSTGRLIWNGSEMIVEGDSPASMTFGSGSNQVSITYDSDTDAIQFSRGTFAQQFRNLVRNGSFEAFSALETFTGSAATGGSGGSGSTFQGGWQNFAPDEWTWKAGQIFQEAPVLFVPGTTVTATNLQQDFYHGKSAMTLEDTDVASSNTYNDTVVSYGTITDGHVEQSISGLKPSTVYAVGAYMRRLTSTAEAIVDITGEDYSPTTTLAANLAVDGSKMTVASVSSFPNKGIVLVGGERISYMAKDIATSQLTSLIRGFEGTTAAAHTSGATVSLAPFKHLTSGTGSPTGFILHKGQFVTNATASDVTIHLICKGSTAGDQCRFDGVQIVEGRSVPEFQPSAVVDTGDQTIYGSLRMGRTANDRGGILSVDKSVRTRAIEFFEKDPGMSGTTGGFGGIGAATKISSGSGSTITLTTTGTFWGVNPRDILVSITQVSPPKFKWEYRECYPTSGCSGGYQTGDPNLNVNDYVSGGSQYNMPLPGSMGVIITFANTGTVTTSDQWSFFVAGMNMAAQYNSYSGTATYTPGQTRIYKDPGTQKLTFQDGSTIATLDQIVGAGVGSPAYVSFPMFFPSANGGGQMYLDVSQGYTGQLQVMFDVEIDGDGSSGSGTRDTFRWRDNVTNGPNANSWDWDGTLIQIPASGGPYGPFPIPGSGGSNYGFTITFGSPAGTWRDGVIGDRWQFNAYPASGSTTLKSVTGSQGISVSGSGDTRAVSMKDCAANEILKRNAGDTDWVCAADATGSGGVTSIAKSGSSALTGAVTFTGSGAVTLNQVGQNIEISAPTGGGGDVLTTGTNTFTANTASPIKIKPSSAPAADTKLFDMQATGAGVTNFSVDAEGDATANSMTLSTALAVASGGTGQTSYTDGQLLIGNSTGNTLAKATLTGTANQIAVANGSGSITLSTPQNIHTAATPQFARIGLGAAADATHILTATSGSTTDLSKALNVSHTGAITGTGYGGYFAKTGASTTNVGLYATASGATNNYAAIFEAGNVGIGTASPGALLHVTPTSTTGNSVLEALRLTHEDSDSAGATGIGARLSYTLESTAAGTFPEAARIEAVLDDATDTSKDASLRFYTLGPNAAAGANTPTEWLRIDSAGNVGIGTTAPSYLLSLGGNSARTIGIERHTTSNTAGNALTLLAGGATSGATDKAGGNLTLSSGTGTGTGASSILFQTPKAGSTGTTDNAPATRATLAADNLSLSPHGTSAGNTYETRYLELAANGTNYVGFKAADALAGNVIWTLPNADSSGTQCLSSNGSGVLSWSACSGAGGYATLQEEGTGLTQRTTLNFVGAGFTAADDAGNSRTNLTLDATLNSLAAYNTNGVLVQTAADTFAGRTLTGTANQITVTNGDGVSGNPTLSTPQNIHTAATPQFARMGLGAAADATNILTATSASTTDLSKALNITHTGAITGTGYGGYFSKTGASTTNIGLYATASGATNNYAAIFDAGNVGIGTTTPGAKLEVAGVTSTLANNAGNINIQPAGSLNVTKDVILPSSKKVILDGDDLGDSYVVHNGTGNYVSLVVDGVEVARLEP